MHKFLHFCFFLPVVAALSHDIYIYQETPEKGFRLSDIGVLWGTYHEQSFVSWKETVENFETITGIAPEEKNIESLISTEEIQDDTPPFTEGFTQQSDQEGTITVSHKKSFSELQTNTQKEPGPIASLISFLLEKKAVFVSGAIAFAIFLLDAFLSFLFAPKKPKNKMKDLHKQIKKTKKGKKPLFTKKGAGFRFHR